MDVIVPYGIKYKKCNKISLSGYKKTQIFPFLEKNLIDKNSENVMAIVAELHCSSYYNDIDNFIIYFFSNYLILSIVSYSFFINKNLQKILNIKKSIKKNHQNTSLINSNEIRNIYCSIFSYFLENKINKFSFKIESKCYIDENYLLHSNLQKFHIVYDENNVALSEKLSRGIREILYWIDNKPSLENIEKILYWINWCIRIEKLEKKLYKGVNLQFTSNYAVLKNVKKKSRWEYFLWIKIWQANEKNNFLNKLLLKSLTKLFYYNYKNNKIKERAGLIAIAILLCNQQYKIKIERKITKMEIFTSLNANQFYKNVQIDDDNDDKYVECYNEYNNIKSKENTKNIYKINTLEKKMDFLRDYVPKEQQKKEISDNKEDKSNIKKITEYFSN